MYAGHYYFFQFYKYFMLATLKNNWILNPLQFSLLVGFLCNTSEESNVTFKHPNGLERWKKVKNEKNDNFLLKV